MSAAVNQYQTKFFGVYSRIKSLNIAQEVPDLAGGLDARVTAANDHKGQQFTAHRLFAGDTSCFQPFQDISPKPHRVSDGLHQVTVLRHSRDAADVDYASNGQHEMLKHQVHRRSKWTGQKTHFLLLQVYFVHRAHKDLAAPAEKPKRIDHVQRRDGRTAHFGQHRMK